MSGASITSKHSRRLSKEGGTADDAHDPSQSAHLDEQHPQEKGTVRPADDEEENCGPLVVKSSSEISNSGPPQPSDPRVQESTSNDSPKDALAAEAQNKEQENQPNPSEIVKVMKEVLEVLKDSTIASKSGKDDRSRFWTAYKRVAEEHDGEFLERCNSDMNVMMLFSGLFSAVSTSFIVAMEPNLSPDPNDTTHALLTQLVQLGLGNFTAAGSTPAAPASTWSPSMANIRIQSIAYASLSFSLLAAFGAMLCKQWLGYYKSQRYGRGSEEDRLKNRQAMFDGINTWHFDAVVKSFPVLLQISLLLFGIALSATMWYKQSTIAWVMISTTVFGFLFYSLTVMAALMSPACPFQTPISTILEIMLIGILWLVFKLVLWYPRIVYDALDRLLGALGSSWTEFSEDPALAVRSFAWLCLQPLLSALHRIVPWLRSLVLRTPARVVDSETQPPDENLGVAATNQGVIKLKLLGTPANEAPSIKWLLETSTDPEVFYAAANLVPHVDWPLDLDVSDTLRQLRHIYYTCLETPERIIPSLEKKASACIMVFCHLYCHRILQGRSADGFLSEGIPDHITLSGMLLGTKANVLVAATKMAFAGVASSDHWWRSRPKFMDCPDSDLEWLSRTLPFHFITGPVDDDTVTLAMLVIKKLPLFIPSPSPQIKANWAFLACVMVGVQFDKKDIVRVDKSSALTQLVESFWEQLQKGDLARAVPQVWYFGVICRVLDQDLPDLLPPEKMWHLGVYRKIYLRARSFEHSDRDSSASLLKMQRFRFTVDSASGSDIDADDTDPTASGSHIDADPTDPTTSAWLWAHQISLQANSHSPEDFDWLVDYLGDVCSNKHKTAGDILVLLSGMRVSCSPAKQHLFIEKLIACMGSSIPPRLRHAALRVVHSSREVLASIDVVDVTKLSPAIHTAVCPQPGATSTDDDPHRSFDWRGDLYYLELLFALARNSVWHPHLLGDGHIDWCSSIIAKSCVSRTYDDWKSIAILQPCAFYLAGIFLRTTSEQVSVTSLSSITKRQWWDMMRRAWYEAYFVIDNTHCVEFLPVLVEGTKKYMNIASKPDLEQLIGDVDDIIERLKSRGSLEQREVTVTVEKLRGVVNEELAKFI